MANLVALMYNWWHLYVRLYDGKHHREAITSRPALLSGVGRLAVHQNQRKVRVSLQQENSQELAQAIAHVSNTLQRFWAHCGALERRATLEFAIDSYFSPLAGWQMAWNAPAGGRISPLGLRSAPSQRSRLLKAVG